MVKNRLTQVIFQTVYVVLGVFGIMASTGYFKQTLAPYFYIYYTNLSNYLCVGFMFASLIVTTRLANKEKSGFISFLPKFKFVLMIMILVTCLVFNFMLAQYLGLKFYLSIENFLMHIILPIMFTLDWILFYEHGKTKWFYPLLCTILPLIYVAFILVRSLFVSKDAIIWPYYFLDLEVLGWGGLALWVIGLLAFFVGLAYVIFGLDHIRIKKEKTNEERR